MTNGGHVLLKPFFTLCVRFVKSEPLLEKPLAGNRS